MVGLAGQDGAEVAQGRDGLLVVEEEHCQVEAKAGILRLGENRGLKGGHDARVGGHYSLSTPAGSHVSDSSPSAPLPAQPVRRWTETAYVPPSRKGARSQVA